jgi:methyl-accepting chemotaxis protein
MKISSVRSLRFQIPFFILGIVIPSIVGAMGIISFNATETIQEETEKHLALEAKGLKDSLSQWDEMNILALQNLSQQPDVVSLDPAKQKLLLAQMIKTYKHLYLAHTTDLNGANIARSDNQPAQNYSDRLYIKGAKAGNDITYQTLMGRTSKKPALCLSTPIRQQQTIAAVAVACSVLDELSKQVNAVKIGQTGYALVIDDKGRVLAHRDPKFISGDDLTDFSNYPPAQNLLAGNEGYFPFTDETGTSWVAHGTRLTNGWGIIVLQEKAEAFLAITQFELGAIAITLVLVFSIAILTWFVADNLTQPIRELTDAAIAVADGKFDRQIEVKRNDELGMLTISFNLMAQHLQELLSSFQDRTLELHNLIEQQNQSEQEQKQAKEQLQQEIKQLQFQLEPINRGDLTVSATITDNEIGQVASYYNRTIAGLRQVIAQVQAATQTVAKNTNNNEATINNLSTGALQQTEQIAAILDRMQVLTESMKTIAVNAEQAEKSLKQATEQVKVGDLAIEETVRQITSLGQTTSETTKQVKQLGKASHKIAKAISLIRKIALQTNVLAVNASIEAARAGDEGLGFTVVANEVQALATQSAQAATDIEQLVAEIQLETDKVVKSMEASTQEVMTGSQKAIQVRNVLQQVVLASKEIDSLVETLAQMVIQQSLTSESLTKTMEEVAAIATQNSSSAVDVSSSFRELRTVAKQLETSVGKFKVV